MLPFAAPSSQADWYVQQTGDPLVRAAPPWLRYATPLSQPAPTARPPFSILRGFQAQLPACGSTHALSLTPTWWHGCALFPHRGMVWCELLLQLPYFFVAAWVYAQGES